MDKATKDLEWKSYKSRLIGIYFNNKCIAPYDSPLHEEFKLFLSRFESKMHVVNVYLPKDFMKKAALKKDEENPNDQFISMEPHYDPNSRIQFPLKTPVIEPALIQDIPQVVAKQFEQIVNLFIVFVNKREYKKIEKIRTTQAALPIAKSRDEILKTVRENQVVLLAGDTGCGKSTQLPQYLLQDGYNKIACTQPRRIATMALAKRVGEEMLNPFGTEIGFQTRFEKNKSQKTRLLFLTDGLLIRKMAADPLLSEFDVIILDEVHERHAQGDLLVALLKLTVQRRQDLKLILMSATVQLQLFSKYFEGAPVIQVPGRLFPIELQWIPVKEHDIDAQKRSVKLDTGPYLKVLQMIDTKYPAIERGDLLIFLNGISEMTILAEALKEYAEFNKRWIVLLLHSTLSVEEQNKVFDVAPPGVRKVIISTNIAETSVTIDEIRFVIDSGKVNQIGYDSLSRTQKLSESWISKASAEQRKGRCGRTGPGVCYRLYSQEQFDKFDDYTIPEIKRISLESLVMQILSMDMKIDVRALFHDALSTVVENLKSQNIVQSEDSRILTPIGAILASLPVDLVVGKMLVYGVIFEQLDVALSIAAGLSIQSVYSHNAPSETTSAFKQDKVWCETRRCLYPNQCLP
ncbi:hypothetical protein M3Y97_00813500 [Aphelenchoides bicaudatus]|nr:hypothetical protein M3Y97_00813500 [Aphelenchoides bicaudatus]